jgi:hypothetical protein
VVGLVAVVRPFWEGRGDGERGECGLWTGGFAGGVVEGVVLLWDVCVEDIEELALRGWLASLDYNVFLIREYIRPGIYFTVTNEMPPRTSKFR